MWQGDLIFDLSWRVGWLQSIVWGGTPDAEATFRGQVLIMRMKGRLTILGVCCTRCMLRLGVCWTRCMLYSVYAVLSVNSWSCHGEIERNNSTLCSGMMEELWMGKRQMRDEDENNVEDTSGYEKSGVRIAWLGWEDLVWVWLPAGSGIVPAVWGMVSLTRTWNCPKFQFLMMVSPISSPLALSCPQLYHHLRTQS